MEHGGCLVDMSSKSQVGVLRKALQHRTLMDNSSMRTGEAILGKNFIYIYLCIIFTFIQKEALGKDLIKRILLHLDLVEKDYFALQFMDSKHIAVSIMGISYLVDLTLLLSFYFIYFL